ncbi:Activity-dependent neuroprotector homeobox protein [Trichinella pseudospiralis]
MSIEHCLSVVSKREIMHKSIVGRLACLLQQVTWHSANNYAVHGQTMTFRLVIISGSPQVAKCSAFTQHANHI